jgi:hypothetical protein
MSFQNHLKTCPYRKAAGITVTKRAASMDVKVAKLRELWENSKRGVRKEAVSFVYLSNSGYNHDTRSLGYGYRYLKSIALTLL